jgi:hypothetical protein
MSCGSEGRRLKRVFADFPSTKNLGTVWVSTTRDIPGGYATRGSARCHAAERDQHRTNSRVVEPRRGAVDKQLVGVAVVRRQPWARLPSGRSLSSLELSRGILIGPRTAIFQR